MVTRSAAPESHSSTMVRTNSPGAVDWPDTLLAPAVEPIEQRRPRTILGRNGTPGQSLAISMQDAADHPPVVHPRFAAELWQQRLNHSLLHVTQPELLRHDPPPDHGESDAP